MVDFSNYNPNAVSNTNNNIFGMPTSAEDAELIIIPVPWEVTVSYGSGTGRAPESIFKAAFQVDIFDPDIPDAWKHGYYMQPVDKQLLMKSDILRNEAELYIDYITQGNKVEDNRFMQKSLNDVNLGGIYLNEWVYQNAREQLNRGKLVGILGGDHSVPLGYYKAMAEKYGSFGILQVDAHCDLRESYEGFTYSHASIMYNALKEISGISTLVQVGVRDYGGDEWEYIKNSSYRVITYFDAEIKGRQYDGDTWKHISEEIIDKLPEKVLISFDIDGLDRKLCPHTGTPVPGGFELDEINYLFKKILKSGRQIIGFDLTEVGVSDNEWNANVGARALYKLCNLLIASNKLTGK